MSLTQFEELFKSNFEKIIKERPLPDPPVRKNIDIVSFQMEDMVERVEYLENKIQVIKSKTEPEYKRVMEYCVRFAVDLDNINVVGREEERAKRRELLARLDDVSKTLLNKYK
ncbi:unnamed protein product [Allacma fusca]|uniref:BAG domain-containing protein n=1 Tax=Allacma fusca TaxID=39272 RepID=A0A8J2JDS2_9HEXA|nr:unnamed protein product [Allacma fusca]